MSRTLLRFSRIVLLCAAGTSIAAQQPPAQRAVEAEATNVTAIVVDVVVRDKQGNPIQGLTANEFQIFEDGVPQDLGSLTAVSKPPVTPPGAATTVAGAPGEPVGEAAKKAPEVLALVFDRLSADGRALAFNAANQYIGQGKVSNNVVAVFGIDLSLVFHQQFTRDADAIRAAIRTAGGRSTSTFNTTREQVSRSAQELISASNALNNMTSNAGQAGASSDIGGAAADAQFATIQRRMAETFQSLERDEQGFATANALMAVVSAMKAIPGRKSVVFFTEGLAIPPNVKARFESVIDAANRANVSIYPMDAAGLRTLSTTKETLDGVNEASAVTLGRDPTADVTDRPMMMALEKNEDLLRADPHSGLGQLADQTGGFLIANTNDLRNGFQRIDTDMRNYYVLTYVSKNPVYDGKFRTIDVKVKRNGARISSRKGYSPCARRPARRCSASRRRRWPCSIAPSCRTTSRCGRCRCAFPTPIGPAWRRCSSPWRRPGWRSGRCRSGSSWNPTSSSSPASRTAPVRRSRSCRSATSSRSRSTSRTAPRRDEILFYREPVLGPGVYTLETAVYDAVADKASVRIATVEINGARPDALRVSSLIAVRRAEKVPEAQRVPGSPLYVGEQLLTPSMGEPFSKALTKELPFYFVVYPAKDGTPTATLSLLSAGKPLAEVPLELGAADAKGRIPQVSRIPLDALQPGTYELRVAVKQGTQTAAQGLTFRLAP